MYSSILVLRSSFFILLVVSLSEEYRPFRGRLMLLKLLNVCKVLLKEGIIGLGCLGSCSLAPNIS